MTSQPRKARSAVIERIRAHLKPKRDRSWFGALPTDVQAELLEARRSFHAGEFGVDRQAFFEACLAEFTPKVITVKRKAFHEWLDLGKPDA